MKKDVKATANAVALVGGAAYVICAVWVAVSRENFMSLFGTWFHGVDVASLPFRQLDLGGVLVGLVTFVISSWLAGYFFAKVYNSFAK